MALLRRGTPYKYRRNSVNDYVQFLTDNPGYYTENELHSHIFHFTRGGFESNKKYADLLRRAWAKGLIDRRLIAGKTNRYEWFLTKSESAGSITDSAPEEKNFPQLLENRNIGQTFTLTNSNNINSHNMENTSITAATVQSCISSIFSKDDVLNLLEQQKAEILASIPAWYEPKPTTELSRDILRKLADAVLASFETSIEEGLGNVDFDDIARDADVEIGYDRTIEINIDSRSVTSAVNEAINDELPDAEGLADLIEQELVKLNSESAQ
jgi:hypothetical protein